MVPFCVLCVLNVFGDEGDHITSMFSRCETVDSVLCGLKGLLPRSRARTWKSSAKTILDLEFVVSLLTYEGHTLAGAECCIMLPSAFAVDCLHDVQVSLGLPTG